MEDRLQQMSANQCVQLASETAEREIQSNYSADILGLPLFDQHSVTNEDGEVSCSTDLIRFSTVCHMLGEFPWHQA